MTYINWPFNCYWIPIVVLFSLLLALIVVSNCLKFEHFSAPGLTLTMPPSWFPQIAAKKYDQKDWQSKMYLDRYQFYDADTQEYLTEEESNRLASTNRFWIQ